MKKLLFLLLFPSFCLAQKAHTYCNLDADLIRYNNSYAAPGVSFSLGAKGKVIGLGAGGTLSLYSGAPFIPVFFELSAYSEKRVPRPQFDLRIGYGLFIDDSKVAGSNQKGGLYFRPGVGYMIPASRTDFVLKLSYVFSQFVAKGYTGETVNTINANGWAISAGFSF